MEMYAHYSIRSGGVPITCPNGFCPLIDQNQAVSGGRLTYYEVKIKQRFKKCVKNLY